jgi:hypothetical protein
MPQAHNNFPILRFNPQDGQQTLMNYKCTAFEGQVLSEMDHAVGALKQSIAPFWKKTSARIMLSSFLLLLLPVAALQLSKHGFYLPPLLFNLLIIVGIAGFAAALIAVIGYETFSQNKNAAQDIENCFETIVPIGAKHGLTKEQSIAFWTRAAFRLYEKE